MKLYLMRHGDAKKSEPRSLSKRGKEENEKMARCLSDAGIKLSAIFCSGELRAKETAEMISHKLGVTVTEARGLNPEDDAHMWLESIREKNEDVMLVGHLPNLASLLSLLLVGEERDLIDFRKSSVVCLESLGENWVMKFFITPEII